MIIIRLWGGIGNQLFQYSFGEYLRKMKCHDVKYDISSYGNSDSLREFELQLLNENINIVNNIKISKYRGLLKILCRFLFCLNKNNHFISEADFRDEDFKIDNVYYFEGYWQNEYYVNYLKQNDISFPIPTKPIPDKMAHFYSDIKNSNSIALHVRRGDYFIAKNVKTYGVCDTDYYHRAISYLYGHFAESKIFVFSDDLNWVKSNLKLPLNTVFIDNIDINQYWYIYLMASCKHNIISNSTFSWWGGYLNQNPDKIVVSPKRWTLTSETTLALSSWIKV